MPKKTTNRKKSPANRPVHFWLFKSEADCYSINHLAGERKQTTFWDGVRNYQARNMLRDEVQPGDGVFFYHSNSDPLAIVGTAQVVKAGYPDHTAFDPQEKHFDPKSSTENPTWYMVDIQLVSQFPEPITREMLREDQVTSGMMVLARGSRLSIQPVTPEEWKAVHKIAGVKPQL
ncbi:MAG: EVE domain-containing protein [Planctomycetaceae bacterium]|nr:EVE domain-containing protein [Planctomycetaceae bacterium]